MTINIKIKVLIQEKHGFVRIQSSIHSDYITKYKQEGVGHSLKDYIEENKETFYEQEERQTPSSKNLTQHKDVKQHIQTFQRTKPAWIGNNDEDYDVDAGDKTFSMQKVIKQCSAFKENS